MSLFSSLGKMSVRKKQCSPSSEALKYFMRKIAIECHNLENQRWGIGRHLSKILEEISKKPELQKEFRFYLYFKSFAPNDPYLNNPIFTKRVLKIPFLRPSYNIFFHILLPLAYIRDRIDVAFFPGFMLPLFFFGKSLVVLTNDIYYEYKTGNLPLRYRIGYRLFSNWAAKRATKITTYTKSAKKEVARLFKIPLERIIVNYLGVQAPQIHPFRYIRPIPATGLARRSPELREELKKHHTPPDLANLELTATSKTISAELVGKDYLVYVGQAFPRRRAKETIRAFEILAPKFPDLKLILVGQDKYNPPILKKLAKEINERLGEIKVMHYDYIDSDEELKSLISGAKLFIYLSTSEAMGLPPLEALSMGTPPLVKDNDLNREIYEGNAFYVADETDPEKIALAIERALNNKEKKKEIIENAQRVVSKFSWQNHTEKLLQILRKI